MNKTFTFQDDLPIDYLKEGKVIALPTDTVYGLAIKADSSEGYKRLIEIIGPSAKTVDALSRLELPSGVEIEIKL